MYDNIYIGKGKKGRSGSHKGYKYGATDEMAQKSNPNKSNDEKTKKRISFLTKRQGSNTKNMPYMGKQTKNNENATADVQNISESLFTMYKNDPSRNHLADERYLNDGDDDNDDEEEKNNQKSKPSKKSKRKKHKPPQREQKEDENPNYNKEILNKRRVNDTLPSPALKRGRIVHHLTAHPSKAPFGALLSAFEQLLESLNKHVIRARVDVLNQYGCMSSCICKLLHILRYDIHSSTSINIHPCTNI